ncbi:MAG TPA: 23S rRNA (guanosine(2251)-2'-O)-methyltransferase RlmB [Spirochaetota bacterium]|nr:23S rRNA (guanosine(2251)-2'-O)-methyltransferase RlmB [Spirochaetota bacterium]HPP49578.1 23S rRNA (guanosine(2251)-2'-O)-methyltransferase RlmB [Spirochaetota bacterium]
MDTQIVVGRKVVLEYLTTLQGDATLYVSESAHGKIIDVIIAAAHSKHIPVQKVNKSWFDSHCAAHHQGVALVMNYRPKKEEKQCELKKIASSHGVIVACDEITDPHNIGSIIRTTEALGGSAVVVTKAHAPEITPTIIKASAGATAHIPVLQVPNLARFLDDAKKAGFWVIGTSDRGTQPINTIATYKPAVVIIGSEGSGMRQLTQSLCDIIVRIPLKGKVSSLNASVACGIVLWELLKE